MLVLVSGTDLTWDEGVVGYFFDNIEEGVIEFEDGRFVYGDLIAYTGGDRDELIERMKSEDQDDEGFEMVDDGWLSELWDELTDQY